MQFLRKWRWLLVAGVLGVSLWCAWAWTRPPRINVLLITLDTTRADRLGPWDGPAQLTPLLDELAAQGVVFERAYAPVPITLPSHASMFTGLFPPEHGLRVNNGINRLGTGIPVLAEALQKDGYSTGAFIGAFVLDSKFGLDRGFDRYDDELGEGQSPPGGDGHGHRMRDGQRVVDSALEWLTGHGGEPFFCWVHLFDPHSPYRAREEVFGDTYRDRPYDAGIAWVDRQSGRLLDFLRKRGIDQRTLVIVAGDHGESLGEHQEREHGFTLYNATLQVPLIVRLPGEQPSARRVPAAVSLVDLFPTVLDALGLPIPGCSGRSLLPACRGEELGSTPCYAESDRPLDEAGWAPLRSLVTERWKYIRSPRAELYDLDADPHELNNLAESDPARVEALEWQLEEREGRLTRREAPTVLSSSQEKRTLASLGYAGGGQTATSLEGRPDIKDMLPHYNAYIDAQRLLSAGEFEKGAALLEPVVKAAPTYFQAWFNLGVARQQLKQLPQAEEAFERAVEIDPNAWARMALGKMLLIQGKLDKATTQFEAVVESEPERAEAHYFLGEVYRRAGRKADARAQYRQALDADLGFAPAREALHELR